MILGPNGKEYVSPVEKRSINLDQYLRFLTDAPASQIVTPQKSLSISAVYACIRILADAIAMTPIKLFSQTPGSLEIEQIFDGPLARITKNPSSLFNRFTFWHSLISSLNGWGNGYAGIIRNASTRLPEQLIFFPAEMVSVQDTTDPRYKFLRGETPYIYQVSTGMETFFLRPRDMIHIVLISYDGIQGMSPIGLNQATFQVANEQVEYGRSFYASGGKITGVIESPLKSTRESAVEFVEWFNTFYSGTGSARIAFLPNGLTYKAAGVVNPEDADWVEARKMSRNEIASIFRVPSYLLGDLDRATWGNVAQLSEEFVRYTLQPLYTVIEDEMNRKLLDNSASLYYQFDPSILLRGTATERFENYNTAITAGFMSRSEVRLREGMPHVPELDAFVTMPGANQVGEGGSSIVPANDPNRSSLEDIETRSQFLQNELRMLQGSLIQFKLTSDHKFEEQGMLFDRRLAEQLSRVNELAAALRTNWERDLNKVVGDVEESIVKIDREVVSELEDTTRAIEANTKIQTKINSDFRMRGTKHQNAIVGVREDIAHQDKQIQALEDKLTLCTEQIHELRNTIHKLQTDSGEES